MPCISIITHKAINEVVWWSWSTVFLHCVWLVPG